MFLVLNQVYYWRYKSNTYNKYNLWIKTLNLSLEMIYKSNQSTKQSRLGFEQTEKRENFISNVRQGVRVKHKHLELQR